MTNERPASWRMPSPKQMEKLAREAARQPEREKPDPARGDPLLDELWHVALTDPRAAGKAAADPAVPALGNSAPCAARPCRLEIGQRLIDQTCINRTGRHEEDGC